MAGQDRTGQGRAGQGRAGNSTAGRGEVGQRTARRAEDHVQNIALSPLEDEYVLEVEVWVKDRYLGRS